MATKGRHFSKTRPELIVRGERHGRAKLTASEVAEIRTKRANGSKQQVLADEYGVSKSLIGQICNGEVWR
jgi:hypothetical protein